MQPQSNDLLQQLTLRCTFLWQHTFNSRGVIIHTTILYSWTAVHGRRFTSPNESALYNGITCAVRIDRESHPLVSRLNVTPQSHETPIHQSSHAFCLDHEAPRSSIPLLTSLMWYAAFAKFLRTWEERYYSERAV